MSHAQNESCQTMASVQACMAEEYQAVETYIDMPLYQLSTCDVMLMLLAHKIGLGP